MNSCQSNRNAARPMRSGSCRPACTSEPAMQRQRNNSAVLEQGSSCPVTPVRCNSSFEQMSQEQLLMHINHVSFVVVEMQLYLDSHPDDRRALDFIRDHIVMRNNALKEYARLYGPLTIDTADDNASNSWEWVNTPWPWEGRCK